MPSQGDWVLFDPEKASLQQAVISKLGPVADQADVKRLSLGFKILEVPLL